MGHPFMQVTTDKPDAKKEEQLERELVIAKRIQTTLLNGEPPVFDNGEITGTSIPAYTIGGDYFDFIRLEDGTIRILIGDVMGKGIPAAMLMILLRGSFRSLAYSADSPGEILTLMNKAMVDDLKALRSFITLYCADYNPDTKVITFSNAGHHEPLWIRTNSKMIDFLPQKGIMIGGLPDHSYENHSIEVTEGDTIFFYTDGIIEAQNSAGELYRLSRLKENLNQLKDKSAEELQEAILNSIRLFVGSQNQKDDITMVILQCWKEE